MTNKVKFTTPFGTAQYPHLSAPDTQGKYADGKYKVSIVLPLGDAQAQAMIKTIEDAATALDRAGKSMHRPYDVDEEANTVKFKFKTAYAPAIFDAQNRPIPSTTRIGGGSVIRIMGNLVPFEKGISAQMNQVQVRELNGPGVSAFEAVEDGYSYEGFDEPTTSEPVASNAASLDI